MARNQLSPDSRALKAVVTVAERNEIHAAAARDGLSVSQFLAVAAIERARRMPGSPAVQAAVHEVRALVGQLLGTADALHQALDRVSDAARIPPPDEH